MINDKTIRCGNCRETHSSVTEVRECHGTPGSGGGVNLAELSGRAHVPSAATPKQLSFINNLLAERDMSADVDALSKSEASELIERLLSTPKVRAAPPADTDVPEGYYAVESLSGNNDLDFFCIQRPTKGRWAGYVFVKQVVGGHPDFPVKGDRKSKALAAIEAAGIAEASARYGQEIGRCGMCNRTLTNEESRELGIGPDCRSKM